MPRGRSFIRSLILTLICGLAGTCLAAMPSYDQVRKDHVTSDARLLDRNGKLLHELRVDAKGRRLEWVLFANVSPALRSIVVTAEDKRFHRHGGVDWSALVSALGKRVFSSSSRGASTISMQLASLLDPSLRRQGKRRGVWLKFKQMRSAWELEKKWTKDQILEAYLNLVSFRGELRGIAAASRGLYGKDPHGVSTEEAAILAALIRSPNTSVEKLEYRACLLGRRWDKDFSCEGLTDLAKGLAQPYRLAPSAAMAAFVAQRLLRKDSSGEVISSLNYELQKVAYDSLSRQLLELREKNARDGAVLVLDNATGEVLAYVGNAGDLATRRYVDAIQAPRQAGSTLKPFLYALAMERRILTPASLLEDTPLEVPLSPGVYRPENYDKQFRGLVTLRAALASSLNIPAVRTLLLLDSQKFVEKLRQFGISDLSDGSYYGPSLALGSADVTLWDLTNAYRSLANGGRWSAPRLTLAATPEEERQALDPAVAYLIGNILSDRESRALTFGLENPLATRFWSAVKTGTSKDMRDNWCVGYSSRYTVGVWVGNFSGDSMWNVTGMSGAAPVWIAVMNYLHARLPSRPPSRPDGVVVRKVALPSMKEVRLESFLAGTETDRVERVARTKQPRITYPVAGEIVALDPDIPRGQQKLFFSAKDAEPGMRWVLNGKNYASGQTSVPWAPRPGSYVLALVDEKSRPVDSVPFEVRGVKD